MWVQGTQVCVLLCVVGVVVCWHLFLDSVFPCAFCFFDHICASHGTSTAHHMAHHPPPGTDSSAFKSNAFIQWRQDFYTRLRAHTARANTAIGCTCGHCGEPLIVAFAGKRQLQELWLGANVPKRLVPVLHVGPLDVDVRPPVRGGGCIPQGVWG